MRRNGSEIIHERKISDSFLGGSCLHIHISKLTCMCHRYWLATPRADCTGATHYVAALSCQPCAIRRNRIISLGRNPNGTPAHCPIWHLGAPSLWQKEFSLLFHSIPFIYVFCFKTHFECMKSNAEAICLATRFVCNSPIPMSDTFDVRSPNGAYSWVNT